MKKLFYKILQNPVLFSAIIAGIGFAIFASICFYIFSKSDINEEIYRVVNVYTYDGDLIATYEGKIDIDNNANSSVMFDLDGKRYVYYGAIVEIVEK